MIITYGDERCFALAGHDKPKCNILTHPNCIGYENCSSYKTKKQCEKERVMCLKRLQSLPEAEQKHIEQKYNVKIWKRKRGR